MCYYTRASAFSIRDSILYGGEFLFLFLFFWLGGTKIH